MSYWMMRVKWFVGDPIGHFRRMRCSIFGHKFAVMGRDSKARLYAEGCTRCNVARLTPWELW